MPLLVVAMVAGPWARNLGADLRTWTLAYPAYLAAVLDPFTSIFRYLIPLFPLLVVVLGAGWADRRGNTWRRLLWRFVPLLVLFVVGQYCWTDDPVALRPPERLPAVTRAGPTRLLRPAASRNHADEAAVVLPPVW